MNLGALIFPAEDGLCKLNYVTKYELNISIPKTSVAAGTHKENKMEITLEVPIDNFADEEVQNLINWSDLPKDEEWCYRQLSLYIKEPDGYEKSVVFTHASILMEQFVDINDDYIELKVHATQKRDKTGGVAIGENIDMTGKDAWSNLYMYLDNEWSMFDDFEGILGENTGADNAWQEESFDMGWLEEQHSQQKPDKTVTAASLYDDPKPSTSGHVPKKAVKKNKTNTPSLYDDPKPSTSGHKPKKAVKKNKTNTPSLNDDPKPSTSAHVPKKSVNKNKTNTPSLNDDPKPSTSAHVAKKSVNQKTVKYYSQEEIQKAETELLELKKQWEHYEKLKDDEPLEMCIARLEAKKKYEKQSRRVYRMKNPDKVKQQDRNYRLNNPDKVKQMRNRYYEENKDKIKEKRRQYAMNNPDKKKERDRNYRLNNPDKIKERNSRYYQENKDRIKEKRRKNRRNTEEKVNKISRKSREKNKEKIKERDRNYARNNPEKIKEKNRRYRIKNKEKIKEKNRRYRIKNKEKINAKRRKKRLNIPESE